VIRLLLENPLLLLFAVIAIGYPLGRVKVGGLSLGVAAVLFSGLAVGSLHPDLKVPELVYQLGLALFVYTVGLSNGRGFFSSFRRKGLRDNLLVAAMLAFAASLTYGLARLLGLGGPLSAGLFAGALTNTPALAGVVEAIKTQASPENANQLLAQPVVGYSVAYPVGVVGVIAAIAILQRFFKVDYAREAERLGHPGSGSAKITNRTVLVTRPEPSGLPVSELLRSKGWSVVFGRVRRGDRLSVVRDDARLEPGDLVTVVGMADEVLRVQQDLGEQSQERIDLDREEMDFRRMFVSNPKVLGRTLRELALPQKFGAVITRIRRGDVEFLPRPETELELGDRVRVVTRREVLDAVGEYLGDSYLALSEIDVVSFSLGLGLGLLLGMVRLPLPGGSTFSLGLAGGPLLVALLLGAWGRTGPLVWTLPFSANLTLRQLGLILFLAGVGTRSGYAFVSTLHKGGGLSLFLVGATVTCTTAVLTLIIGHKLLKIPMGLLVGMVGGLQTQPAVLGFASEQSHNDLPNVGYATVYPLAFIAKLLLAQGLLAALGGVG
jgi:putative transport protein